MNNQFNMKNELETPYEGYLKGNMFRNLYEPYKNYRPMRLVPNNEQAEMLLTVNELGFAAHELRLLLDNYPNDLQMIQKFNEFQTMSNEAVSRYENKYGPITESALSDPSMFSWEATPWPWEMED